MPDTPKSNAQAAFDRSSSTEFGSSLESQTQIEDAAGRSSPKAGEGEKLHLYRLIPTAPREDPRWANSPCQGEIIVAARTTGDARLVATGRELDFMEIDSAPADDVTTINASAFRDDKLYTVVEIETDRTDLRRGVVEGSISVDNIRPTQSQMASPQPPKSRLLLRKLRNYIVTEKRMTKITKKTDPRGARNGDAKGNRSQSRGFREPEEGLMAK
jgi:hypothetical protein